MRLFSRSRRRIVGVAVLVVVAVACASDDVPDDGAATVVPVRAQQRALDEALIGAAWNNDVALARELVESGADVNFQDGTRQSAYLIATSEGYDELLRLTLEHGADVTSTDSFNGTGLIRAAERGHADVVGQLLRTDIDVDHVNNLGWTALHEAIILGTDDQTYVDTVRLLVAGGADVTIATGDGYVPVQLARGRDRHTVVSTLEAASSAPLPTDPDAALLAAAANGDPDAAAIALAAGADIQARDEENRTALELATAGDHRGTTRLLAALGGPDA